MAPALLEAAIAAGARDFAIDPDRWPPRLVERAGEACIEAILAFRTAVGQGAGLLRIQCTDAADGPPRAWTLLTALQGIAGHDEATIRDGGRSRPSSATSRAPTGSTAARMPPAMPTATRRC